MATAQGEDSMLTTRRASRLEREEVGEAGGPPARPRAWHITGMNDDDTVR
jgi:hypothetical protein